MPLFICSECGCVDNSHLVNKSRTETRYNYKNSIPGEMEPKFYPYMDLRDMQGHGEERILLNGRVYKEANEIKMLCSECNCEEGWHGEFTKTQPTEIDKNIALYSEYNMITPFDHESGCLTGCKESISEYKVWDKYEALHFAFRDLFGKKHTDHIKDFKKNYFPLMHKVLIEDPMNFEIHGTYDDVNWNEEYDVLLHLLDGCTYENESKSDTLNALKYKYGFSVTGHNIIDAVLNPYFFSKLKTNKHWKETQSEKEKNEKLRKAEEKRLRKQQRR